jgi:hypothetical protein
MQSATEASSQTSAAPLDRLTIMAIGIVTFIIANVLHEAVGHGGACLLVGGGAEELSSAHFSCHVDNPGGWQERVVASAGTLVNFAAAIVFSVIYRGVDQRQQSLRYFSWLGMCTNYFVAAGYPLFSGLIGVGDWVDVVQGWQPAWMWKVALVMCGAVLYFVIGIPMALRSMTSLIGAQPDRLKRASTLSVVPYLAGATATSIGALFNPIGAFVVFTSAAAAFGGNSALAWMTQLLKGNRFPQTSDSLVAIPRSWSWIVFAATLLLIHVFVLGPSIRFV